jgi:hypothetical protein
VADGDADLEQRDPLEEVGELFEAAFPDMRCLRCDFDAFAVIALRPDEPEARAFSVRLAQIAKIAFDRVWAREPNTFDKAEYFAKVICRRCGFVQEHYLPPLAAAEKPIRLGATRE